MDYRIAYSRQNLTQGADFFREVDLVDELDPGELHRKISRQVSQLGYQIAEENLGIMRRPVGGRVGDVLGILHGTTAIHVQNGGVVVYGLLYSRHTRDVLYESHLRVALSGEFYHQQSRANLAVMIAGKVTAIEKLPPKVSRSKKADWFDPQAIEAFDSLRQKLEQDVNTIASSVEMQQSLRRAPRHDAELMDPD